MPRTGRAFIGGRMPLLAQEGDLPRTARSRLVGVGLVALVPLLLATPPARADAEDSFDVTVGVSELHDSNLFNSNASDDITISTLGLKIHKPYSLQRFELDASLADNRYRNADANDFQAFNYAAAWRWSLTPNLHGNLTSTRSEALDNPVSGSRNLRVDENQRFDGVLDVSGAWRLLAGVMQAKETNSELSSTVGNTRLNSAEGGLRYDFSSGSSLSYIARSGRGDYFKMEPPNSVTPLNKHFDQSENEVRLIWLVTAKTTIDARAAYLSRTYDQISARDYAGSVGSISVNWGISDKTSLTTSLGHELSSYQTLSSSYIRTDRFTLNPVWQITEKTTLRARYIYAHQSYLGAITASALNDRVDNVQTAMAALEWTPLRALSISATLQNEKRRSNQQQNDSADTIAGVVINYAF